MFPHTFDIKSIIPQCVLHRFDVWSTTSYVFWMPGDNDLLCWPRFYGSSSCSWQLLESKDGELHNTFSCTKVQCSPWVIVIQAGDTTLQRSTKIIDPNHEPQRVLCRSGISWVFLTCLMPTVLFHNTFEHIWYQEYHSTMCFAQIWCVEYGFICALNAWRQWFDVLTKILWFQ